MHLVVHSTSEITEIPTLLKDIPISLIMLYGKTYESMIYMWPWHLTLSICTLKFLGIKDENVEENSEIER
jgi:hypothetical protein